MERFQAHPANERTFLSWVRTAIAIAGFGIVIEKLPTTPDGTWIGLLLLGLSAALVAAAAARFLAIRRQIERGTAGDASFAATETLFAVVLGLLLVTVMAFIAGLALVR